MHMPSQSPSTDVVIRAQHLSLGWTATPLLEDLSFEIVRGSFVAILGPNGSGKSTLMQALLGLLPPLSGDLHLFGRPPKESYGRLGYVPQRFPVDASFPMSVGEFLNVARPAHIPPTRIAEKLGEVGLNPLTVKRMPLSHLSGGQLQRVLLARAILRDPEILFLDEPSAGVDAGGEQAFFELLRHQQQDHHTTIVMISHEIQLVAAHVDTVLCLNRGLVCQGHPSHAMTDAVLKDLYGQAVHRHTH